MMGSISVDDGEASMAFSRIETARSSSFRYSAATDDALAAWACRRREKNQRSGHMICTRLFATHEQPISMPFAIPHDSIKRMISRLGVAGTDGQDPVRHGLLRSGR